MGAQTEQKLFFTSAELERLDANRIPQHVAIIPDGNRRWAKQNNFDPIQGHQAGCDGLMDIVDAAIEIGIRHLTFFTFSTENWNRSRFEVQALMRLLILYLSSQTNRMVDRGVRLSTIGDLSKMPDDVQAQVGETMQSTIKGNTIDLILALNYGGRDELLRAFKRMLLDNNQGKLNPQTIEEATIDQYLDTAAWPNPDVLIRTSGEQRISNFLLWQLSYSEIISLDTLWPDFTPNHLLETVISYQQRNRRLGK